MVKLTSTSSLGERALGGGGIFFLFDVDAVVGGKVSGRGGGSDDGVAGVDDDEEIDDVEDEVVTPRPKGLAPDSPAARGSGSSPGASVFSSAVAGSYTSCKG